LGSLHCGQAAKFGAFAFLCVRLLRPRAFDTFPLGSAIIRSFSPHLLRNRIQLTCYPSFCAVHGSQLEFVTICNYVDFIKLTC
jgi:hypothetical protein